jgi:hypothetical protein
MGRVRDIRIDRNGSAKPGTVIRSPAATTIPANRQSMHYSGSKRKSKVLVESGGPPQSSTLVSSREPGVDQEDPSWVLDHIN